jgi:ornithine carbamoyltransferase
MDGELQGVISKKDILSVLDLSSDLGSIIDLAINLKSGELKDKHTNVLSNKSMAMIFEKSSTRTRVSFEVAMTQLGGHSLFLSPKDLQLGRGETVADTAKVLSRYVDIIMYRAFKHSTMIELANSASVPVINALDELEHPCQIVADLQTIKEHKGTLKGLKMAYVGDGNNVCNSLLLGAALVGINLTVGCPEDYDPDPQIYEEAKKIAQDNNCIISVVRDPKEAVSDCDVIYTDVWVSMGDETEAAKREQAFLPYQVNNELINLAKNDCIIMHCLPAHRGLEITDEVVDSQQSVVFDEAENRLHAQKAIILHLLGVTL